MQTNCFDLQMQILFSVVLPFLLRLPVLQGWLAMDVRKYRLDAAAIKLSQGAQMEAPWRSVSCRLPKTGLRRCQPLLASIARPS